MAKGQEHHEILMTRRYELFVLDPLNRTIQESVVQQKMAIMKEVGFVWGCPMYTVRLPGGKFEIRDGQHRFKAAERLQIEVYYTVETNLAKALSAAQINAKQKGWTPANFVDTFVKAGNQQYKILQEFTAHYGVPLTIAADLLSGNCGHGRQGARALEHGQFVVKDFNWACRIGEMVAHIGGVFPGVKANNSVAALSRLALVKTFSDKQMIHQCQAHPRELHVCATLEQYSEMFERVYYFHRSANRRLPLTFLAKQAAQTKNHPAGSKDWHGNGDAAPGNE